MAANRKKNQQRKTACVRQYKFAADAPTENLDLVLDAMKLANKYRNRLCEIERDRRQKCEDCLRRHYPELLTLDGDIASIDERIEALRKTIKQRNAKDRKRSVKDEEKEAVKTLNAELKLKRAQLKRLRDMAYGYDPDVPRPPKPKDGGKQPPRPRKPTLCSGELELIDSESHLFAKQAREESGLYWPTYQFVEEATTNFHKGAPPQFRSTRKGGTIAVHPGNSGVIVPWEKVGGPGNSMIRVESDPENRKKAVAWFRVGSEAGKPIWAKVPFTMHRIPPPGTLVTWVYLARRKVGFAWEWTISFVLTGDSLARDDDAQGGSVGVHFGWRRMGDHLRVAYWLGSDGEFGELTIPMEWARVEARCESLRSIQDGNFNAAKERFAEWLESHEAPEWMRAKILPRRDEGEPECTMPLPALIRSWRSAERLFWVVWDWRDRRCEGDETIYPFLETWRKQHKHVNNEEVNLRRKTERRRLDLYRNFARMLARRYRSVVVESTDYKSLARNPTPTDTEDTTQAKTYLRLASPGALRQCVCEAAAESIKAPKTLALHACHICGTEQDYDRAENLVHNCPSCGNAWDSDYNAAARLVGYREP